MPHAPHLRKFFGHKWQTKTRPLILERAAGRCEHCHHRFRDSRLQIAHLYIAPGEPFHDDPDNLAALCDDCHKRHDRPAWLAKSKATRCNRKDPKRPLFELLREESPHA